MKICTKSSLQKEGYESALAPIVFMINERDLSWVPNFIALGIYFTFGSKFSWNEGIDTCLNVKCGLLDRKFDFLGAYCWLHGGFWWLLLVTAL